MISNINDQSYDDWVLLLKSKFKTVQLKTAVAVNTALLQFYWELGQDIIEKQQNSQWGEGFLGQLSIDLMAEFPDIKGFSVRNLKYIRQWYSFWQQAQIGQQAVAQLMSIPWGHTRYA